MTSSFTRSFYLLLLWPFSLTAAAQTTLTESLRRSEAGRGEVVLIQSQAIEKAVNEGNAPAIPVTPTKPITAPTDTTARHTVKARPKHTGNHVSRGRHRARGYRICIFTGGNSRSDKTRAVQMGQKCRNAFPELSVYTTFQSPRWVTHVGDFRNKEDAEKYVKLIRRARFTYETKIVGSVVNLPD